MKFTIFASLLAASGLVTAAPFEAREASNNVAPAVSVNTAGNARALEVRQASCPVTQQGDYTWKISNFTGRKPVGTYWSLFSFRISSTNPGSSYDEVCESSNPFGVLQRKWIKCGPNSSTSFAFDREYSGLWIRYGNAPNEIYGTTDTPFVCRAAGTGPGSQVCTGTSDRYVALLKLPSN